MSSEHRHHQHQHAAPNPHDPGDATPSEFWEDFYSTDTHPWTGNPNEVLVNALSSLSDFTGTTAADLGCGSGADAVYLAQQGLTVTAVDISAAALAHGRDAAQAAGVDGQITWTQINLDDDFPSGSWDLIASSYLHSPVELGRASILSKAAAAVNPGGALIVIGHDGVPHWNSEAPDDFTFPSVDEVLAELNLGDDWSLERKDLIDITIGRPEGQVVDRTDSLIVLRRR
ncbi:class I SAM-dependent methyltransferase [Gordonia sp. TBRC 11910]|uniref:Class I SAM-dependent methyltransferase n=1 Tax=Gordonia asplenii TaxID=2725283 RepID=A0A848KVS3_9ACTN|nr:class I SAM-dependent methyltransferase [Gordonia asplenii]NMO02157.1 class I SAM-dependent methyltransferase [Gordonia asplenii]